MRITNLILICTNLVFAAGCATIDDLYRDKVEPELPWNQGEAEAVEATEIDDIDLSNADWKKVNGRNAKTTQEITALTFDGSLFRITTSDGTKAWSPSKDGCNQYACFFVFRNGRYVGGKFDWQRPGNTPRDTKNIRSGYTDGIIPVSGESVWYCQINLSLSERTNCKKVVWK